MRQLHGTLKPYKIRVKNTFVTPEVLRRGKLRTANMIMLINHQQVDRQVTPIKIHKQNTASKLLCGCERQAPSGFDEIIKLLSHENQVAT